MACDNCDCLACRIERGEISCDDLWNEAGEDGRARQTFGDFRCWVSESGAMMFQYRTGYNEYEPVQGEECCLQGTEAIFRNSRALRIVAERAGWREPADFQRIQDDYNRQAQSNAAYYQRSVEELRAAYEDRLATQVNQLAELREALYQSNNALADLRERAQQPEMVLARMDSPSEG